MVTTPTVTCRSVTIPAFAYNCVEASRILNEALFALTNVPLNVPPVLSRFPTLSVPANVLTPANVYFHGPSKCMADEGLKVVYVPTTSML